MTWVKGDLYGLQSLYGWLFCNLGLVMTFWSSGSIARGFYAYDHMKLSCDGGVQFESRWVPQLTRWEPD